MFRLFSTILLCLVVPPALIVACGSEGASKNLSDDDTGLAFGDDTSTDDTTPDGVDDASGDDTGGDGPVKVIYDYFLIDGTPAPPNPVTGAETPDEFNKIPIFRFRADTHGFGPRPVNAIFIIQAGFIAGANQMFFIARNLVELSGGAVEVWIPERRHTLLEDQLGMDTAEALKNPYIAYDYYFEDGVIDGKTYTPPDPYGPDTDMMSEWGLDIWMHDLRRVIDLIPEEYHRTNVFLAGDSRGVAFTQAFAAYEFEDGKIGADDLTGLICWDGGVRTNPDLDKNLYLLDIWEIRRGLLSRTVNVDIESSWFMEIFGMISSEGMGDPDDPTLGPDGFFPTYGPFEGLFPFLTRWHDVRVTNESFIGLVLDSDYMPYPKFMGHLGQLTGPEIKRDIFGYYPAQDGGTYSWLRWNECTPREFVDIQKLARMLYEGPSNFTDFHYSARLDLDLQAADFFETEGTWRHDYFHFYTSRVDVPVFAIVSKLYAGLDLMEKFRNEIAPVRGTNGPRDDESFKLIYKTDWSHLDAIAVELTKNDVLPGLLDWIGNWSSGQITIPAIE